MRRVYLLGAGLSRAVSPRMPVATELGERIKKGLNLTDRLPTDVEAFGTDFEAWLTYLGTRQPWHDDETSLRHRAAFALVARSIYYQIDGSVIGACAKKKPPDWLEKLVRNWMVADPATFVITFNYDTLIELTYVHTMGTLGPADPQALYGVRIPAVQHRYAGSTLVPNRWQPFPLVKLHGSTNWYYAGLEAPNDTAIYSVDRVGSWGENEADWNDALLRQRAATDLLDLEPLIVPPTLAKGPFYANRQLAAQWQLAARRLQSADELVCIGFSLPPADTMVRSLLATCFEKRIVLVDRDRNGEVRDRFRQLFGTGRIDDTFCGTDDAVMRYVQSLPDVSDRDIELLPKLPPVA